ncbi:collectin-10 [Aplochiton taeniatus]
MERQQLLLLAVMATICRHLDAADVCSSTILPGSKGDDGEGGDEGDQGRLGKNGAPGHPGEKGDLGGNGPPGLKGKQGSTCDCGRYRKVVGQLDLSVNKLRSAVKFVKNVILGIRETEESFFLMVKEARRYREALINCRLRGGSLATPKTSLTNQLLADYVNHAGLTRVFIGIETGAKNMSGGVAYTDGSALLGFEAWSPREEPKVSTLAPPTNSSCVALQSTGTWGLVSCDLTMYYICQFPKSRREGMATAIV